MIVAIQASVFFEEVCFYRSALFEFAARPGRNLKGPPKGALGLGLRRRCCQTAYVPALPEIATVRESPLDPTKITPRGVNVAVDIDKPL